MTKAELTSNNGASQGELESEKARQDGVFFGGQHKELHLGEEVAAVAGRMGDTVFHRVDHQKKVQVMRFQRPVRRRAVEGQQAQVPPQTLGGDCGQLGNDGRGRHGGFSELPNRTEANKQDRGKTKVAERVGFEPTNGDVPITRFPIVLLRPTRTPFL